MTGAPLMLYLLAGAGLFVIGFGGVWRDVGALRRVIAVNVMGNGVFLIFVAMAAPVAGRPADPVPHALVLTGIVVAVCATGLVLTLEALRRSYVANDNEGPES